MRKIETRIEKEKRIQRNQILIGIILVGLMILSTAGYAFMDRSGANNNGTGKVDYKGIEFNGDSGYWSFKLNNNEFVTQYNPKETEGINPIIFMNIQDYSGRPMYFVSEQSEALTEFARNLNQRFVLRMQRACLTDINCSEDLPIKNCSSDNIIVIKEPNKNEKERVYQQERCVFIVASYANQTKFSDAVLFKMLGI